MKKNSVVLEKISEVLIGKTLADSETRLAFSLQCAFLAELATSLPEGALLPLSPATVGLLWYAAINWSVADERERLPV